MTYNVLMSRYSDLIYSCSSIIKNLMNCDLYVFGSYAKGCVKPTSDLDLLILVDESISFFKKTEYIGNLEDAIYAQLGIIDLDLKIINKKDFFTRSQVPYTFENIINQYMVEVL